MSSSVAAVEARILEDPEDDDAWRAYAPWLRAQGDPRGELIALAGLADTPEEQQWVAAQLVKKHVVWTPAGVLTRDCVFRRGFVVAATMRVEGRSDARALAWLMEDRRSRLLGELRLVFAERLPSRALKILERAALERLRALRASYHARGDRVALVLARQPALNLRTLDLRHSGLTDEGLVALAGCAQLRGLRALYLQRNRFTARGVAALAEAPALAEIEVLDLRHNAIGASGAAALAASPHLGVLRALHLHAGELDPAGVRALATSATLPHALVRFWRAQDSLR